ncbi:hypothetical protein A4G19_04925 [Pasteurellaceae bacterium Macca]|nr:hypothetical protein [Pasteurellaceae bacterium Macca]
MWHKHRNGQIVVAFSFIELLVSLLLSSTLLGLFATFYSDIYRHQHQQRVQFALQKQSHQLLDYLQKHLQHIGYQGLNREPEQWALFTKNQPYYLEKHCLLFFYDINQDGCLGKRKTAKSACQSDHRNHTQDLTKEIFGFKFLHGELYAYEQKKKNNLNHCYGTACQQLLNHCDFPTYWEKIADQADYQIADMTFQWYKKGEIIETQLTLASTQTPTIRYHAKAYSYLLNHPERKAWGKNHEQ